MTAAALLYTDGYSGVFQPPSLISKHRQQFSAVIECGPYFLTAILLDFSLHFAIAIIVAVLIV
jgi:hypothetical protein